MRLRERQRFSVQRHDVLDDGCRTYSIGVQTAYPDRQVVAFTGDGSATMMMGELATLAQHSCR